MSVSLLFRWKRQLEAAEGRDNGKVAARALMNQRLRELELQLDALKSENTLLREALERSVREGRAPVLPPRPSLDDLRTNGRA